MAGHSRSKNGVASLAYCPGHPRLSFCDHLKSWMPGTSPGMTEWLVRGSPRLKSSGCAADLNIASKAEIFGPSSFPPPTGGDHLLPTGELSSSLARMRILSLIRQLQRMMFCYFPNQRLQR
jgi:hypothetical protein